LPSPQRACYHDIRATRDCGTGLAICAGIRSVPLKHFPVDTPNCHGGNPMHSRLKLGLAASAAFVFLQAVPVQAAGPAALTGQVPSAAEGAMEGVVVTARKTGGKTAISVISDAQGHYSFPADRLEPGEYSIKIRAVGYDLNGKAAANVAKDKPATV